MTVVLFPPADVVVEMVGGCVTVVDMIVIWGLFTSGTAPMADAAAVAARKFGLVCMPHLDFLFLSGSSPVVKIDKIVTR